jgi:hypothetical protein
MVRLIGYAEHQDTVDIRRLEADLKLCLTEAKRLKCPGLARKLRSAIKSAGGAVRHMDHRAARTWSCTR